MKPEITMCHHKQCRIAILFGVGILIAIFGCGKPKIANRKPVVPVRGAILFSGRPAAGAIVCFHPLDDPSPKAMLSRGSVGSDGVFLLTTYAKDDGAPKGEYTVTVYWPDPSKKPLNEDDGSDVPPDLLQGRFAARQGSILRAKVGEKTVEFAPIDLGSNEVTQSREYPLREK